MSEDRGVVAEIVTSGTEILLGDIVDTNAAWIAQQLREAGVSLYYKTTVGDNEARLRGVVELGMSRSDVVLVTGGLGPTVDDVTRQAIAAATGRPLILHEGALATLRARFERFGAPMTDNNLQQAYIPTGALLIENPVGTAPGFIVETERSTVIALPGVPREMKHLMTETVLPYLRRRAGGSAIIRRRILRTMGIGESAIDAELGELMHQANPTVGLAAHTAQADVRIAARAETAAAAEALLDTLEAQVRARIGRFIYSTTPDEAYETALVQRLRTAGLRVAVAETNTGARLAQRLRGAVDDFDPVTAGITVGPDGAATGAPAADWSQLAGLLAEATPAAAAAAAAALLAAAPADVALALAGTRGADEGVFGRESGVTWIGVAGPQGVHTVRVAFGGSDDYTIVRVTNQALRELWKFTE